MTDHTEALVRQEQTKAQEMLTIAQTAVVKTDQDYITAGSFLKTIKGAYKGLDEKEKEATRPMLQALEKVRDWFRPAKGYLTQAESAIKLKIGEYQQERERLRLAQEAKLREKAEADRKKLEAQALKLAEQGKTIQAEAKLEAAASIPSPVVIDTVPQVKGVSFREIWDFEITDAKLIPPDYLIVHVEKIRKVVQAAHGEITITGVRIFKRQVVAAGTQ